MSTSAQSSTRLAGGGIHDARRSDLGDQPRERSRLLLPAPARLDRERQVGSLEAGDEIERVLETELGGDVGADVGRGGGREGGGRHAQLRAEAPEPPVVRAEIVAPLADAVGLVHDEPHRANAPEQLAEAAGPQALGGDVHQVEPSRRQLRLDGGALVRCAVPSAAPRRRSRGLAGRPPGPS